VEDGIGPYKELSEDTQRLLMRILVLSVGALAYWAAVGGGSSLVQLLATAYGIVSQLAPPVVAAMYWRRATTTGVVAGLLGGWGTAACFYLNPGLRPLELHEGILGLVVHVPVLVAVSLLTRPQNEDHIDRYVAPREVAT